MKSKKVDDTTPKFFTKLQRREIYEMILESIDTFMEENNAELALLKNVISNFALNEFLVNLRFLSQKTKKNVTSSKYNKGKVNGYYKSVGEKAVKTVKHSPNKKSNTGLSQEASLSSPKNIHSRNTRVTQTTKDAKRTPTSHPKDKKTNKPSREVSHFKQESGSSEDSLERDLSLEEKVETKQFDTKIRGYKKGMKKINKRDIHNMTSLEVAKDYTSNDAKKPLSPKNKAKRVKSLLARTTVNLHEPIANTEKPTPRKDGHKFRKRAGSIDGKVDPKPKRTNKKKRDNTELTQEHHVEQTTKAKGAKPIKKDKNKQEEKKEEKKDEKKEEKKDEKKEEKKLEIKSEEEDVKGSESIIRDQSKSNEGDSVKETHKPNEERAKKVNKKPIKKNNEEVKDKVKRETPKEDKKHSIKGVDKVHTKEQENKPKEAKKEVKKDKSKETNKEGDKKVKKNEVNKNTEAANKDSKSEKPKDKVKNPAKETKKEQVKEVKKTPAKKEQGKRDKKSEKSKTVSKEQEKETANAQELVSTTINNEGDKEIMDNKGENVSQKEEVSNASVIDNQHDEDKVSSEVFKTVGGIDTEVKVEVVNTMPKEDQKDLTEKEVADNSKQERSLEEDKKSVEEVQDDKLEQKQEVVKEQEEKSNEEESRLEEPKAEEIQTKEAESKAEEVEQEELKQEDLEREELKTDEQEAKEITIEEAKVEEPKLEETEVEETKTEEVEIQESRIEKVKVEESKTEEQEVEEVKPEVTSEIKESEQSVKVSIEESNEQPDTKINVQESIEEDEEVKNVIKNELVKLSRLESLEQIIPPVNPNYYLSTEMAESLKKPELPADTLLGIVEELKRKKKELEEKIASIEKDNPNCSVPVPFNIGAKIAYLQVDQKEENKKFYELESPSPRTLFIVKILTGALGRWELIDQEEVDVTWTNIKFYFKEEMKERIRNSLLNLR